MKLYNTLTHKIKVIEPINPPNVSLYTCGPTVYDFTHIGHMRAFTINDLLKRTLDYNHFKVKRVMNITDVGHLTGDDDSGIDKLEKGAKKTNKTVWEVVKFFTDYFFETTDTLNILRPDITCCATDHINEMVELIKKIFTNGFAYETKEAVYFNVSKFSNYGKLSGQKLSEKLKGVREDVYVDKEKINSVDFALWFKKVGRFADHTMHWPSPWGEGFPGWHIECSAMGMKYLGETIDIHTGGIDHIPVHHENEIAQSESATGKQFVKIWVHNNFLMVNNQKMSKSLGNIYKLEDLKEHQIDPLAVRYLFLQSHYRQLTNFTWESAKSAQEGYVKLKEIVKRLVIKLQSSKQEKNNYTDNIYSLKFKEALNNDLQIPEALATAWEMLKSDLTGEEKLHYILDFDKVFGLKLSEISADIIPDDINKLSKDRLAARASGDYKNADEIRLLIESKGYKIMDSKDGQVIKKLH